MPLNFNGKDLLERCIPSIVEESGACQIDNEIWVIDNNSHDDSENYITNNFPSVHFFKCSTNKILASYNDAFKVCQSPYILILNNDMMLTKDSIFPLYQRMKSSKDIFAVSPHIDADKSDDGFIYRTTGSFFHGHLSPTPLNDGAGATLYFHGGAALLDRKKFLELGGFDSAFFYFEDNDLSYRAWKRNWSCIFEPQSKAFHLGSQTTLKVHGHLEQKRALKEKANNLFILKNIHQPSWLFNYFFWTALKLLKMVLCFDRHRFWAYLESFKQLPYMFQRRQKQGLLSDIDLMEKIKKIKF